MLVHTYLRSAFQNDLPFLISSNHLALYVSVYVFVCMDVFERSLC